MEDYPEVFRLAIVIPTVQTEGQASGGINMIRIEICVG